MKDKKLQVFVSSTFMDLKEERQAAVEAILSSGHIPAGMELFSAGDESQMTVIKRWIDQSDVYLLILGGRYGSVESVSGKSYTHLEYEYALEKGIPLFSVVISEQALDQKVKNLGRGAIEQDNAQKLKDFKAIVLSNLVKFWEDKKDIKISIHETLSDFSYRKELIGWVRGDSAVNTGFIAEEIAKLTKENAELRNEVNRKSETRALFAGMDYSDLEGLLKEENVVIGNDTYDLFHYLLNNGELVSNFYSYTSGKQGTKGALAKLAKYKLAKTEDGIDYTLTEDGHNFYLRALLEARKKERIN